MKALLARLTPMDEEDGIDLIYREIDGLLCDGEFGTVDSILVDANVPALRVAHALAFASITHAARDRLHKRVAYMLRLRAHITATDPHRVDELLSGLE